MRIVIAGCGRVGSELAVTLADEGNDVSVIDSRPEALRRLGSTFNGSVHEGLAYDVDVLREAGLEYADAFVAVTNQDNANLMAVQVAKEVFDCPKTIARLDDPSREEAYRALDIQYVPGAKIFAKVVHEAIVEEEFQYHLTFSGGNVEVVDLVIGAAGEGLTVEQLEVDDRLRVAAVRRADRTIIPDGSTKLKRGDLVVAAARHGIREKIVKFLAEPEGL